MPQFSGTGISTTIVTFRKDSSYKHSKITISYGESVTEPNECYEIDRNDLRLARDNWRNTIPRFGGRANNSTQFPNKINFVELFGIKRGLATGANSFFVMEREQAKQRGVPDKALKPLLPKARFLKSLTVYAQEDGYPDVVPQLVLVDCDWKEEAIQKEHPTFFSYLQLAKQSVNGEKAITERTLVKSRKPWYSQEKREPAPFLLTYMGRNKKDLPPLYFILNKSKALALNTYLLLYPVPWLKELLKNDESLYKELLQSLNKSAESIISQQTRI